MTGARPAGARWGPNEAKQHEALWLFCQVVDNFGDAGVSWRLARELAARHGFHPTLIIDDPATLARIEPRVCLDLKGAPTLAPVIDGVRIQNARAWSAPPNEPLAAVVVSAFGCDLPQWLRSALAGGPAHPLWIHLDYLSAEPWVDSCNGLVSVKPTDAAREHFIYPGFTVRTAGLLREADLVERRAVFEEEGGRAGFFRRLGVRYAAQQCLVSLFAYPSAPIAEWFACIAQGNNPTLVCAAGGCADEAIATYFGRVPAPLERLASGRLEVVGLPMLSQNHYDELLWSCDINLVRGEDSWIRAHWAHAPLVWQAYPQTDGAHHRKLEAFLKRLSETLPASQSVAPAEAFMRAWNRTANAPALAQAWQEVVTGLAELRCAFKTWTTSLEKQSDLATQLALYCRDRI